MAKRRGRTGSQAIDHSDEQALEELLATAPTGRIPGNFENHFPGGVDAGTNPYRPESVEAEHERQTQAGEEDLPADEEIAGDEDGPETEAEAGDDEGADADVSVGDVDRPPQSATPSSPQRSDVDLARELEAMRTELAFLRANQPGAPPPAGQPERSVDDVPLPFQLNEHDVQAILQGGPQAAAMLTRAFQLVAASTARHTAESLARAYNQNRQAEVTSERAVSAFFGAHPDLQPFAEVVQARANEVWAEFPNQPIAWRLEETARRTRQRLTQWGLTTPAGRSRRATSGRGARSAQPAAAGRRIRPAESEMGQSRPNGVSTKRLTAFEREMFELIP